jgi:phosphoesterase RecJ-like protein
MGIRERAVIEDKKVFLKGFNLKDIEAEDIISMARSIMGIKVTLFFKEIGVEKYRISVRSKGSISAQEIAKKFNGGGHDHAAGFYYDGTLKEGKKKIMKEVQNQLENDSRADCN